MKKLRLLIFCLLAAGLMPCRAETIVALMEDHKLRYFDSATPGTFTKVVSLTRLTAGAEVLALDFRPTGELFLVTREETRAENIIAVYEVNPNSGIASKRNSSLPAWTGASYGFDFAPKGATDSTADAVIANDQDELRQLSPDIVATPVTLHYDNPAVNPRIVALAFSNSFPEAEATILYGIDAAKLLVRVNRMSGQLEEVGSLSPSITPRCGFDISGLTGKAYASFVTSQTTTSLFVIDLETGEDTHLGQIGGSLTGVGVVDIAVLPPTRLLNISTRSRVGTGDDAMIAGFITQGGASSRLIIRGLGPSLSAFGIPSPLADPFLTVFNSNGAEIASNDNWRSAQESEIIASQLAPTNNLEAAYIGIFAPGAYTAQVRGVNDATGVGVVEVFKLSD